MRGQRHFLRSGVTRHWVRCVLAPASAFIMTTGSIAFGQDAAVDAVRERPRIVSATSGPRLLREGARLVEAAGEVVRDAERGGYVFHAAVSSAGTAETTHEFRLLPSTRLEEIAGIMEGLGRARMPYEITGRVYLYEGRNYLLVQQAIQHAGGASGAAAANRAERTDASDAGAPPDDDAAADSAAARRSETDRIIADLEQSLGSVPTVVRDLPQRTESNAQESSNRREGQMLVQRRGRPIRLPDSTWRFVFDADAAGFADPPMTIMPCRMLERLQQLGQRDTAERVVRISGEVFTYRGSAFLMPLSYHEASGRSRLGG